MCPEVMTSLSKTCWSYQEKLELLISLIKLRCNCWLFSQNLCPCYSHWEALTLQCWCFHCLLTALPYLCPLGHGINSGGDTCPHGKSWLWSDGQLQHPAASPCPLGTSLTLWTEAPAWGRRHCIAFPASGGLCFTLTFCQMCCSLACDV